MVFGASHAADHRARVQARVPERVVAAGWAVGPSSLAGPADAEDRRPLWLGITPTRLYAFRATDGDVGELVGAWDRAEVTASAVGRFTRTTLRLRFAPRGSSVDLDVRRGTGNGPLVRALVKSPNA